MDIDNAVEECGGRMDHENPFQDEEEREHFQNILAAFKYYESHALQKVTQREKFIAELPPRHQRRLGGYTRSLQKMHEAIAENAHLIAAMVQDVESIFHNVPSDQVLPSDSPRQQRVLKPKCEDVDKVLSVLKQVVRDWSAAGEAERAQCYGPILEELIHHFPHADGVSVLVPGAGLGRLAYEIAQQGYTCQGNEVSLFMLFASNFVLNKCHQVNSYKIYPWVHQFVNNLSCEHQLQSVSFPDIPPSQLSNQAFSMVAGDFTKVYMTEAEWDCVATCFFIDCAPNVIDFIETIFLILKPGGLWINLGPLLYHYSDMANTDSIEPPFDVLCDIIKDVGFIIQKAETRVKSKYSQNPNSMLQYEYDSVFLLCRKPED